MNRRLDVVPMGMLEPETQKLSPEIVLDKLIACWMGKNIGGTLGEPVEGTKEPLALTFFTKVHDGEPLPNDDLDLQLVNFHALEMYGTRLTAAHLAEEWLEHVFFPYDEYGYALANMRRGFRPPFSGYFQNPFTDCMGAPIRSELWAAVAPGCPALAAYLARQDAAVDHAGGEGVHGEVFYAALESLAFSRQDTVGLIEEALSYIPQDCRVYAAVRDTLSWYQAGVPYTAIREKILARHGRDNFTDAPQNIAFTMVGLLYGNSFADGLLKAVNLGYDTDCTGATLGALYGILYGTDFIPAEWAEPVGRRIVVSDPVKGFTYPRTIDEFAQRIMVVQKQLLLDDALVLSDETIHCDRQEFVFPRAAQRGRNLNADLRYVTGPYLFPGQDCELEVLLNNKSDGVWHMRVSIQGSVAFDEPLFREVHLAPGEQTVCRFRGRCEQVVSGVYPLTLRIDRLKDGYPWTTYVEPFILLGASQWTLDGASRHLPGGEVAFRGVGRHTAETELHVPSARRMKLICASTQPVSARLDGEEILCSPQEESYMPAFHRAPEKQTAVVDVAAGDHVLQVYLDSHTVESSFTLLMVAPQDTQEAGAFYSYVDCTIG